jgi:hypothetical protein
MTTKYFFCCLTPTSAGSPFHFSQVFPITYSSGSDAVTKQNKLDTQFRAFLGNPNNYNCTWSPGDTEQDTQNERAAEIANVGAAAREHYWPV